MIVNDFEDLPLAVLNEEGHRAELLLALAEAFHANPVGFYDKYIHSRRGRIDSTFADLDLADRSPAEEAAYLDQMMREGGQ